MTQQINRAEYRLSGGETLVVERLHVENLDLEVGQAVVGLLTGAFTRQLETPGILPPGSVAETYTVEAQLEKMREGMEEGSQYFIGHLPPVDLAKSEPKRYAGIAKFSASDPTILHKVGSKLGFMSSNPYCDAVATDVDRQHLGIGAGLVYTGLRFGGFEGRTAVLDAYSASSATKWFMRQGFQIVENSVESTKFNGTGPEIKQVRMTANRSLVLAKLGKKLTWLGGVET